MKKPGRARGRSASLLVLAAGLLAVLAVACGGSYEDPGAALAPFEKAIDRYTGPFKGADGVKVYRPGVGKPQGYVKGGVVLVEGDGLSVFHDDLPGKLRAATTDDVRTVVLIKESDRKVGKYSGGEPAWQCVWKVSVVDLAKGKVVGRALLLGDHPPFVADIEAGENHGPAPFDDLVAYLRRLARR
jgi:hypothetical protein